MNERQIHKYIHYLKTNEAFPEKNQIFTEQLGGWSKVYEANDTGILNIKICITYNDKSRSSITIHNSGKITGVCPGVEPFFNISDCLKSAHQYVK